MAQDDTGAQSPSLAVWCADPDAAAPLLAALDTAPLPLRPTVADGPLLLLCLAPTQSLTRALAAGTAPAEALAAWRTETDAILRLARTARRRVHLADLAAALARPEALWTALGLPGRAPEAAAPAPGAEPILTLTAQRLLLGEAATRARVAELQAACLDLGDPAGATPDPAPGAAALTAWRSQQAEAEVLRAQSAALQGELAGLAAARTAADRERAALDIALEAARAEAAEAAEAGAAQIDLLGAQIAAMQTELETIARARQQMEARLEQMGQGLDSHQRRIDDLEGEVARRTARLAEKDGALAAAARRLAELETATGARDRDRQTEAKRLRTALTGAQAETTRAETALAGARAELARVMTSRSYRMTAPLRRLRALFGGGRGA